ncbi:hypothetical protein L4G92_03595 [Neisseria sp. ZJ106]|uniref:Uncharacterized protein n=1 Tax=Neisseria lisongii TaxID=2912188 RepID=A0ABY7RK96_9NEIS|nr:hypothetical protein [Neisseria lisongii]MCF7521137.1 hypothetical protein [Neisseria lisongii]WCL72060.1 hypothetical protein PJU73_02795 [Neisseria lisongii]
MKLRDIRLYIPTLIGILLLGMAVWMKIDALAEAALCADLTCMGKDYIPPLSNLYGIILVVLMWLLQARFFLIDKKTDQYRRQIWLVWLVYGILAAALLSVIVPI